MKNDWRYSVNCVLIHHNSQELQDKLKALGFIDLHWTTCLEPKQNLIASSYERTVKGFGYNPVDKHYKGSFWNCGIGKPKICSNVFDAKDDEELFIKMAERIIKEKEILYDKDWNEV